MEKEQLSLELIAYTQDDLYKMGMEKSARRCNRWYKAQQEREDGYFCDSFKGMDYDEACGKGKDKRVLIVDLE